MWGREGEKGREREGQKEGEREGEREEREIEKEMRQRFSENSAREGERDAKRGTQWEYFARFGFTWLHFVWFSEILLDLARLGYFFERFSQIWQDFARFH